MSALFGNAAKGLPALLGVLWGVILYSCGMDAAWQPFLAMALAYAFLVLGQALLGKAPILGWLFIELWVIASISVVALGTAFILWLSIILPRVITLQGEEEKALVGALVGAITAYLAILWTKDVQDANGPFWVGTQYKGAIKLAFSKVEVAPDGDTLPREAVDLDRLRNEVEGWGFSARLRRSIIMSKYLRRPAQHNVEPL